MRSSLTRLFALLLFALPLAADRLTIQTVTRSNQTLEYEVQSGETVDVVIELREPPLAMRSRESFSTVFDRLERDLARLSAPEGARVAANDSKSILRHKFTVAFTGASATIPSRALRSVAALDYVKAVHPDATYKALLDQSVPQIRAPEAWTRFGTRGKGVVVAIIDTGIDYNHASLGGAFGPTARVIGGYDFVNDDADPMDDAGHGTHVAGIVGGNGAGIVGVAPEVSFLAYKVLNAAGGGTLSDILAAVDRAIDPNGDGNTSDRADVVNMSLGGAPSPDDPLAQAVERAIAAGTVFCIATGNAGQFYAVASPAIAPSAISVGALTRDGGVATFSSKGPSGAEAAIKPEVSAPGVGIVSARLGGGTVAHDGTSMATPHVAGVAALVRAVHPQWTPAEVKAAIVGTSSALADEVMAVGAGRVDAVAAISASILASPSVLGFGLSDPAQGVWASTRNVTLTNRGAAAAAVQFSFDGLRDGVTMTAEPTSVELAAGESKTIAVTLRVENGVVPSPEQGSLALSGRVKVRAEGTEISLPWAFVKAAKAKVTMADNGGYYVIFVNKTGLTQTFIPPNTRTSPDVFLAAGTYDILIRQAGFIDPSQPGISLLFEKQRIDGLAVVEASPALATATIQLEATDQNGQSLDHRVRGFWQCLNEEFYAWPKDTWVALSSDVHRTPVYRVKPFSDRFTMLPGQECANSEMRVAYAANHEPLRGVTGDVTRRIGAADWVKVPVEITVPEETTASAFLGPMFLWRGPNWTFQSIQALRPVEMPDGKWSGTMFLTRDYLPGHGFSVHASAVSIRYGSDGRPLGPPMPVVEAPILRVEDGRIVNTPWLTATPTAYAIPPGYTFRLGEGPLYPEAAIGDEQGLFLHGGFWIGALGDERWATTFTAEEKLYDESGALVHAGPRLGDVELAKGKYRYVSTVPTNIDGIPGRATLTGEFDSRRSDGETPTLSALRLESNGVPVTGRIAPGSALTAIFSFYDRRPLTDQRGSKRVPVDGDAVRAFYRAAGATEWTPLSIVVTTVDDGDWEVLGHVGRGTVFRADLPTTLRGAVELRFTAHDPEGNVFDYVLAPAFAVGSGRNRSVRH